MTKFSLPLIIFCFFIKLDLTAQQINHQEKRSDTIVAIVNDEVITFGEQVAKFKQELEAVENSSLQLYQKELKKKQILTYALRRLVDEKLIEQEAKRYSIKISDKTIKQKIQKELKDKDKKIVEKDGVDLTKLMRSQLTLQTLFKKQAGYTKQRRAKIDTFVSPMEIRYYYNKHIKDFTKESKIKTKIITLYYSKNGGKEETLAKAESIVKQLREGADFETMASLHSNDPYAQEGGTWPRIGKGDKTVWTFFARGEALYPEVDDIIFTMKKNEISNPIPLKNGQWCQIVKVVDIKPGGVIPFYKAQIIIQQKLRYGKMLSALGRMKKKLRERAFIWPADLFKD